jgi:signal peptidase II
MQTTRRTSLTDDASSPPEARSHRIVALWVAVALGVFGADQGTKWWAQTALTEGGPTPILGDWLQLRLTHNPGAAFSLGAGYTVVLSVIALAVIAVCVTMARRIRSRGWATALGLLLGGALGNVTDRIFREPGPLRGHVVDFLQLPHWPVFNLADSAICLAAALFVVLSLRGVHLDGTVESDKVSDDHAPVS